MEFHEHLKQLRRQGGYTQEQLAREFHISRQTVSSWEQGRTQPDIEALQKLSDFFSISLDTLLNEQTKEYAVPYALHRSLFLAHTAAAVLLVLALIYRRIAIGGWFISGSYLMMHLLLYAILHYSLKHHEYSFLAGYDDTYAYREETVQRMLSYMLSSIAITSVIYTMIQILLVLVKQGTLSPYIFVCYIIQFCAAILYANWKYQKDLLQDGSLYVYIRSANKLTAAMLSTIALLVISLLSCFYIFNIKNNTPQASLLLLVLLPYLLLNTIWGIVQSMRVKQLIENKQLFAFRWKSYLLFAVDILLSLLLFYICWRMS